MVLIKKSLLYFLSLLITISFSYSSDKKVRDYLTTLQWYPRDPGALNEMLEEFFSQSEIKSFSGQVVGLIGPHAGLSHSGLCAARAYKPLLKQSKITRVILLGISHRGGFYGAAVSDFDFNSTPLGNIEVDSQITAQLAKEKFFRKSNYILQHEHSLENHLPFLQYIQNRQKNKNYKIVPILFGYLEEKDLKPIAEIIKKYVTPETLLIASTDFTHYGANFGYIPFKNAIKKNLTQLDMGMIEMIKTFNIKGYFEYKKKTNITMCGFIPVAVLLAIFKDSDYKVSLMDYYKSGDQQKDYQFSVSYASLLISKPANKFSKKKNITRSPGKPEVQYEVNKINPGGRLMNLSQKEKITLLLISRQTLENYFQGKKEELKELEIKYQITPLLKEKAGVFVTLKKEGNLRGCIGSIIGIEPIWEGVRNNVLKSAFQDPRFYPMKRNELKEVDIEISVMTPLEEIDDYKKIRLGIDGVVIKKGYHQAVFLPQVATETGWNLEQFLGHLCQKAGLPANEFKEKDMKFLIFQALVFEEKELVKNK